MTWPDGIAIAVGITTLALLATHQHWSTTQNPPRTEANHGHQDTPQANSGQEDHSEEDGKPGTQAAR